MKILIVNTNESKGGAARAAKRLHQSLIQSGIDSQMLVLYRDSDDESVIGIIDSWWKRLLFILKGIPDWVPVFIKKPKEMFSQNKYSLKMVVNKINSLNPDVVHLHWIHQLMLSVEDIAKIKAPIVWSMHDMWLFTGGCHYDDNCELYKNQCTNCKILNSNKHNDISFKTFNRKKEAFNNLDNITVVGLSRWLEECAKGSALLNKFNIVNLPNPIDTKQFYFSQKFNSRKKFNFDLNKKLVLFGAMNVNDVRKGFSELYKALNSISSTISIDLVVFGASEFNDLEGLDFNINIVGSISDDTTLAKLYSAVDVMIVPSLQENLSNAIMESLSCSTPVIAFDIGGNSDMIDHKKNGYLAKPFDSSDLAKGIEWVLNNENYEELCINAREKVLKEFDSKVVAKKYIDLYEKILNKYCFK